MRARVWSSSRRRASERHLTGACNAPGQRSARLQAELVLPPHPDEPDAPGFCDPRTPANHCPSCGPIPAPTGPTGTNFSVSTVNVT